MATSALATSQFGLGLGDPRDGRGDAWAWAVAIAAFASAARRRGRLEVGRLLLVEQPLLDGLALEQIGDPVELLLADTSGSR